MLIQLTAEDTARNWSSLFKTISLSLPVENGVDRSSSMLTHVMSGQIQVWVATRDDKPIAVGITTLMIDTIDRERNLVIYSLTGVDKLEESDYANAFDELKKFAKRQRCGKIIAYSNNKRLIQIANKLGGNTETTMISLEV